jgi:hypothetical protein
MKTLFISALMVTSMAMMTSPLKAQYDDDIYYSKSSAKKTAYQDTPTWETSANSDWNVDDYYRLDARHRLRRGAILLYGPHQPFP